MGRGEVRDIQLSSVIAEELGLILCGANDERLSELAITGVQPGKGGGHFTVLVAPSEGSQAFGSAREIKELLDKAASFLRAELSTVLNLKRSPELTFMVDPLCVFIVSEPELIGSGNQN